MHKKPGLDVLMKYNINIDLDGRLPMKGGTSGIRHRMAADESGSPAVGDGMNQATVESFAWMRDCIVDCYF